MTEAGHARTFEETYAWLKPLLRRVPITRLVDVTPLDSIGLPVWSAVTPLATDLTVHAGKGSTSIASRISAIMEAIERVSAERVPPERVRRASYRDLVNSAADSCIDPELFDLPFDTLYDPACVISWVLAYDLLKGRRTWTPLDLVISPPSEGVCVGVETNGLAAGNTYTEAVVHALYEVIERDATSREDFARMYSEPGDHWLRPLRVLDTATLPPESKACLERLETEGFAVAVEDLTSEIEVPVFGVTLVDSTFPGAGGDVAFAGYGADLHAPRAVFRAITEAIQSHTIVKLGARDTFEGARSVPDRPAMLVRQLDTLHPRVSHPFPQPATACSRDLLIDMRTILDRLASAGFEHCLVADLTRDDLQVPVVRVLVPGLAPPYGATTRRPSRRLLRTLV